MVLFIFVCCAALCTVLCVCALNLAHHFGQCPQVCAPQVQRCHFAAAVFAFAGLLSLIASLIHLHALLR